MDFCKKVRIDSISRIFTVILLSFSNRQPTNLLRDKQVCGVLKQTSFFFFSFSYIYRWLQFLMYRFHSCLFLLHPFYSSAKLFFSVFLLFLPIVLVFPVTFSCFVKHPTNQFHFCYFRFHFLGFLQWTGPGPIEQCRSYKLFSILVH